MPTPEALQNLRNAELVMQQAHEESIAYINRQNKTFSQEDRAENERLLQSLREAIDNYWCAFNDCANS